MKLVKLPPLKSSDPLGKRVIARFAYYPLAQDKSRYSLAPDAHQLHDLARLFRAVQWPVSLYREQPQLADGFLDALDAYAASLHKYNANHRCPLCRQPLLRCLWQMCQLAEAFGYEASALEL